MKSISIWDLQIAHSYTDNASPTNVSALRTFLASTSPELRPKARRDGRGQGAIGIQERSQVRQAVEGLQILDGSKRVTFP